MLLKAPCSEALGPLPHCQGQEIGGASLSLLTCASSHGGSFTPVFSSPSPLVWLSVSSLESVDQSCLYCVLYKNRPRGQGPAF